MRIGQDESLQHFDRCLLKLGIGDHPIEELPDSIHIPPKNRTKYKMIPALEYGNPIGTLRRRYFPTLVLLPLSRATVDLWIAEGAIPTSKNSSCDQINAIISQELLHGKQHSI